MIKPHLKTLMKSSVALALLTGLLHAPDPAAAQTVPGIGPDPFSDVARYKAEVFQELKDHLDEWEEVVLRGDLPPLQEFYSDEALFLLSDGTTLIGSFQVAEQVLDRFSRVNWLELRALDMAMSGRMAVIGGRMTFTDDRPGSGGERCFTMVFKREGRAWRIRSHMFCSLPEQGTPARP